MKVLKVRFERKNSSLDLNDSAVMEVILKQVNLYTFTLETEQPGHLYDSTDNWEHSKYPMCVV